MSERLTTAGLLRVALVGLAIVVAGLLLGAAAWGPWEQLALGLVASLAAAATAPRYFGLR